MPRQFCRLLTGVSKIRGIHFAGLIAQAACLGFPKTRYVHFAGPLVSAARIGFPKFAAFILSASSHRPRALSFQKLAASIMSASSHRPRALAFPKLATSILLPSCNDCSSCVSESSAREPASTLSATSYRLLYRNFQNSRHSFCRLLRIGYST